MVSTDRLPPASPNSHAHRGGASHRVTVLRDVADLEGWRERWSALADEVGVPAGVPAVALAWWVARRDEGRRDGSLCVVLLEDGPRLVGVAAFGCVPGLLRDWRLLGSGLAHRPGPVVAPGHEEALGRAVAAALAAERPRPHRVTFEGVSGEGEEVVAAVRRHWPGRLGADHRVGLRLDAPLVPTAGQTQEEWFASRGRNFRKAALRARRDSAAAGVVVRCTGTQEELVGDLDALRRLHEDRWAERGGSAISAEGGWGVYEAIARSLLSEDRLRLYVMELGGEAIGADLAIAGPRETSSLTSGFRQEHSRLQPGNQLTEHSLAEARREGVTTYDLGGGASWYKRRFADDERGLAWHALLPRGRGWPRTRAVLFPQDVRLAVRALARRLPAERYEQVRGAYRTLRDLRTRGIERAERNAAGGPRGDR